MIDHDVLIIGAGLAGMRAALSAVENGADVAVVTKVYPVRSHSNAAQGGINAALSHQGDDWRDHAYDTVKGSDFLGDQDAIEIMCREAGDEVVAMEHMGVIFSRDEDGRLGTRSFGGQQKARTFFVADFTGQALLHVLYEQILKANVNIYDEWFLLSLLVEDGECCGAVVMEISSGEIHVIRAKAVIMASGGLGRVFEPSTNALICTGDGMAAAYRAGASLMDMEMVQYHPTTLKGSGVLITEGARGDGAYLLNSEGDRFMKTYAPNMMELASRDVVSRSEQLEIDAGRGIDGCVMLDMRHLGERFINERLSQIREIGKDFANVDVVYEPIPVRPGMHYQMGGIKTDVNGLTQLPGLYSAGEAACVSVHGGNRLGANSLLDTLVFGRRSGQHASDAVKGKSHKNVGESAADGDRSHIQRLLANDSGNELFGRVRREMGDTMNQHFAVYRNQAGMDEGLSKVRALKERVGKVYVPDKGKTFNTNLMFSLELDMMLDCAEAVAVSATDRPESRGAHTRSDFPDRDDENWLKHILVTKSDDGPQIDYLDVVITDWKPEIRSY
ncbi:MAG: FAD-binding protein [Chloroflexi bacterium]|nr:FAD-binding protein [Chloroflexota bacterium]MCH9038202.1 FAD-binding protein [Chloroflexota bacterium]MCI0770462.1 FAD-binding protein [Chloroflexota bacterium]MCI0795855.1 FAD-binding protein [Chloroflexota bacterium]MCI0868395.1 FAD-binding protein [Chloroflexota bacterium]